MKKLILIASPFLLPATPALASPWQYEAATGVCALYVSTAQRTEVRLIVLADQPEGLTILITNPAWRVDKPKDIQVALTFHKVSTANGVEKIRATVPAHVASDGQRTIISIAVEYAQFEELSHDALRLSISDSTGPLTPELPIFGEVYRLQHCSNPRRF